MPAHIVRKSVEVENRLEKLGLTREKMLEVAAAMSAAKADCTDNDPPGAPGWSAWRMGTRRLREEMLSIDGWERDESDQISSIVNRKLSLRIAVANTDDGTTVVESIPQNRSRKGAATDRAVQANQGSFMDILDASMKVVPLKPQLVQTSGSLVTWYLCVFCDDDVLRAELSCPTDVVGGYFTDFKERIFIAGDENDDGANVSRRTDEDGDGEFDIPVTRK